MDILNHTAMLRMLKFAKKGIWHTIQDEYEKWELTPIDCRSRDAERIAGANIERLENELKEIRFLIDIMEK